MPPPPDAELAALRRGVHSLALRYLKVIGAAALVVLWGLLVATFVAWGLDAARSPTSCPSRSGDSNYGQAGWSWLPPGPTCTFTTEANGFEATDGPGRGSSWVIVALAVTGVIAVGVLWAAVRRLRAEQRALDDDHVA